MRGTWLPTSIENDAPRSSAQCATCGQLSSGRPSSAQMMRAAYGSANSLMNSTVPRGANASISSSPRAWNCGRIAAIVLLRKAGISSRRIRAWSSPSSDSSVSCHQSEKRPEWIPFCAGHRALPCRNLRSRSSADTSAWRSTAQPQLVSTYQLSSRAAWTTGEVTSKAGSARSKRVMCRPAPCARAVPRRARPRCRRARSPVARRNRSPARCPSAPRGTPRGRRSPPTAARSRHRCPTTLART